MTTDEIYQKLQEDPYSSMTYMSHTTRVIASIRILESLIDRVCVVESISSAQYVAKRATTITADDLKTAEKNYDLIVLELGQSIVRYINTQKDL